ncbi:MAG: DUF2442 domain-containing protein [Gordonibacter sp.]|uniref:DUF2442 domain-containing protein n=1 Tax=Gordonibacter sp. TaxID=1968902 RepID=UPI002FC93D2C
MRNNSFAEDVIVGLEPGEPAIVAVAPLDDCRLLLEYENGEAKRFDVEPYFNNGFFSKLKDRDYFARVRVAYDGMSVAWPEGQDICPEDLYDLSEPVA